MRMTALPPRVIEVAPGPEGVTVVTEALRARLDDDGPPIALVPAVSRHVTAAYAKAVRAAVRPGDPVEHPDAAVIVATSGSTGHPRGVTITRANLRAAQDAAALAIPGLDTCPWVLALPATSVGGLVVVARALLSGQPVRMLPSVGGAVPFSPADLAAVPAPASVSVVPAQLSALLDDAAATSWLRRAHAILVGGGRTPSALAQRSLDLGVRIVRTFGMTETTGGCVYDGIPLPGTTATVEEDGRIRLRGPTVAAGYRERPHRPQGDADRESGASVRFDGDSVLTCDLGEWRDGRLHVIGRADDVVSVNGVNVSPHAVEEALLAVPGVHDAAVLAVSDERRGARLVAFVTCDDGAPGADAIAEAATQLLGSAARPEVRVADSLPRLPHGKIDRMSLMREAGAR